MCFICLCYPFFFFFSSRRRHTIFKCDWSSDVSSSDLTEMRHLGQDLLRLSADRDDSAGLVLGHSATGQGLLLAGEFAVSRTHLEQVLALYDPVLHQRSEERRVGKECRSRWSPYH